MGAEDLETEMTSLAHALRVAYPELDGTFATLPALEKLVLAAKRSWNEELLRSFGAYFGETLRGVVGDARWVGFEAASAETPGIGGLGRGADLEAILRCEGRYVFPLAKVQKFVERGREDSLAAFAPVARMMLEPPVARRDRPVEPDALDPDGVRRIDEFLSAPSVDTAKGLRGTYSRLRNNEIAWVLRHREVRSEMFLPLYAEKARGRGHAQYDPGLIAARWTWRAIDAGALEESLTLRELEPLFAHRDKLVRQHAAYVRACVGFKRGDEASIDALYARGDSAMQLGIVNALAFHVNDAVMDCDVYPSVEPHVTLILAAAQGPAAVRKSIAGTLVQISTRVRVSIAPVLPAIIELLEHGRPSEVEAALNALSGHAYGIKHGRAQWSEDMDRCVPLAVERTRADEAKQKVTKTRIAASYAMRALASLGEAMPARHQQVVARSMQDTKGVR